MQNIHNNQMHLTKLKGFFPYILIIFFNAFIDLGHKILIQNTLYVTSTASHFSLMSSIINGLILLPYLLLFTPAGFIADKFKKVSVLRITAAAAIPLTIAATWCYFHGYFSAAFAITLLLATQSAFNSPAKYGYIKEVFGKKNIAPANAVVQTVAIIAILAGTFVFSLIFQSYIEHNDVVKQAMSRSDILQMFAPAGYLLILCSCLETMCTFMIPEKQAVDPSSEYKLENYIKGKYLINYVTEITKSQIILICIIGLSIFWGVNQIMVASYAAYLKAYAGDPSVVYVQSTVAMAGLGILVGAFYAGRVCKYFIEPGLIPASAIAITLCLFTLFHSTNHTFILFTFFIYGIVSGMLVVPLNSLVQYHAKNSHLGRVMATSNFVQTLFMVGFLVANILFISLGGDIYHFLMIMLFVVTAATIYAVIKFPYSLTRYFLNFFITRFFKISFSGLNNIPSQGGVLLLGNHVSILDWVFVLISCPRPVRFVLEPYIFEKWYLKIFFKPLKAIGLYEVKTWESVRQALKEGEVVALFPERQLCRNGQLGQFDTSFEKAAAETGATIIPFYLLGLWGTAITHATKHYKHISRIHSRPVSIIYGQGVADNTNATSVKQLITQLSITAWKNYVASLSTIPDLWLERVKQLPNNTALIDSMGITLSNIQLLSTVLYIGKRIDKYLKTSPNVGIMLPAGAAGIIANLTVLFRGNTVVNLNYTNTQENILNAIQQAQIDSIITSKRFIKKLELKGYNLNEVLKGFNVIYLEDLTTTFKKIVILRNIILLTVIPLALLKLLLVKKHDTSQTAAILFSSGSESKPKGVELTHQNIVGNAKQISSIFNIERHDRMLSVLPLFHAFGLTATTIMPLLEGTPLVCHPDPTDVVTIAKLIQQHKASVMCATSTFLGMYCRNKRVLPGMLSSLRLVIAGAEKLSPQVREQFTQKFDLEVYEGYGATEVSPVASANMPDVVSNNNWQLQVTHKPGSVGLPLPGTAFKIVDPETMQGVPTNTEALILIGGTQVMKGYLNDPEKTQQVLIPEQDYIWYITGDKGKLDEDGFLTIVDRYSRFAKIGGEMVSLTLVEQKIENIVADPDSELMVLATADTKKGEKLVVLHTGEINAQDLRKELLKEPGSNLLIPAKYIKVDAIPKLGSGKKDYSTGKQILNSQIA